MKGECPFKIGTSVGLANEILDAARKELKEYKVKNNVEEPDRKSFSLFDPMLLTVSYLQVSKYFKY